MIRPAIKEIQKLGRNLVGAEIGVKAGENAESIAQTVDLKTLYLVDIWAPYITNSEFNPLEQDFSSDFDIAKLRFQHNDKIVFINKTSILASTDIEANSLDFVYIDANHAYESVKEDITIWTKKVKIGGIVSGHDFNQPTCQVEKAVREYIKKHNYNLKFSGCDWWFVKEF